MTLLNNKELADIGIKTDICGWYNVDKMKEILKFAIEIYKIIDTSFFDEYGGYDEQEIKGYTIQTYGSHDKEYNVDISANGHLLAESHNSKILSHCVATAVMKLNKYKGTFSMNDINKIIVSMTELNSQYSDALIENEEWY